MWLLTTCGFYSVVANRHDPELVFVRARVHDDLAALGPGPGVGDRTHAARGLRVAGRAPAEDLDRCGPASLAAEIDYGSFKDAVAEAQGLDRASLYAIVWATLREL